MSALRGVVVGVLALSALEVLVSSPAAANNAGGAVDLAAELFRRLVDPSVPLIPDLRDGSGRGSSPPPGSQLPATQPAAVKPRQKASGATRPASGFGRSAA